MYNSLDEQRIYISSGLALLYNVITLHIFRARIRGGNSVGTWETNYRILVNGN
jgi:hypothetical protein